jgi:hypothetical protein
MPERRIEREFQLDARDGAPSLAQTAEVPYLLKMPGQKQGLAYNKPMQEIVTKDLLLAIMDREVTTPQQVAAWLDHSPPRQQ